MPWPFNSLRIYAITPVYILYQATPVRLFTDLVTHNTTDCRAT